MPVDRMELQVCCAELAPLSTAAGTLCPLDKATRGSVVGAPFEKALGGHDAGEP